MSSLIFGYILFLVLFGLALFFIAKSFFESWHREGSQLIRLLVIIPQALNKPLTKHKPSEIELSTELYSRLAEKKIPFTLEVSVHGIGEEIHFYIIVPKKYLRSVARLIESLWPTGYVVKEEISSLFHSSHNDLSSGYLRQEKPYAIPLKQPKTAVSEAFMPILSYLSKLNTLGEGASIQWVIKPSHSEIPVQLSKLINRLRLGDYYPSKHLHPEFVLTPESIKRISQKISKPLFSANCRILTRAVNKDNAQTITKRIGKIISEYGKGNQYNHLSLVAPKKQEKLIDQFYSHQFSSEQNMILNAEELATAFHFAGPNTNLTKLKQ